MRSFSILIFENVWICCKQNFSNVEVFFSFNFSDLACTESWHMTHVYLFRWFQWTSNISLCQHSEAMCLNVFGHPLPVIHLNSLIRGAMQWVRFPGPFCAQFVAYFHVHVALLYATPCCSGITGWMQTCHAVSMILWQSFFFFTDTLL